MGGTFRGRSGAGRSGGVLRRGGGCRSGGRSFRGLAGVDEGRVGQERRRDDGEQHGGQRGTDGQEATTAQDRRPDGARAAMPTSGCSARGHARHSRSCETVA